MLHVKYVEPRVEISQHGITYKNAKEDKYIYLMTALEILQDIDNDYEKRVSYTHILTNKKFEEDSLHQILKTYELDIETHVEHEETLYEAKIQQEITHIQELTYLNDEEKSIWIKNIELMKNYKIQRAINKIYYFHCLANIKALIVHKKIKEITTPFNKNFFHVLNSLKGTLIQGKPSLDTMVREYTNLDNQMVLNLQIK